MCIFLLKVKTDETSNKQLNSSGHQNRITITGNMGTCMSTKTLFLFTLRSIIHFECVWTGSREMFHIFQFPVHREFPTHFEALQHHSRTEPLEKCWKKSHISPLKSVAELRTGPVLLGVARTRARDGRIFNTLRSLLLESLCRHVDQSRQLPSPFHIYLFYWVLLCSFLHGIFSFTRRNLKGGERNEIFEYFHGDCGVVG